MVYLSSYITFRSHNNIPARYNNSLQFSLDRILLLDQNSPVSDLSVLQVVQSLLDTFLVEAVCHDRGLDVLAVGKLEKLAEGVAGAGQGALHADALEGERGQGNGGALESGS